MEFSSICRKLTTTLTSLKMRLLHKIVEFPAPVEDMVTIYTSYIRSILEQSCTVWHSSLTQENSEDLERVQKSAMRIILGDNYTTYDNALEILMLAKLSDRREKLSLKFAKNCAKEYYYLESISHLKQS